MSLFPACIKTTAMSCQHITQRFDRTAQNQRSELFWRTSPIQRICNCPCSFSPRGKIALDICDDVDEFYHDPFAHDLGDLMDVSSSEFGDGGTCLSALAWVVEEFGEDVENVFVEQDLGFFVRTRGDGI